MCVSECLSPARARVLTLTCSYGEMPYLAVRNQDIQRRVPSIATIKRQLGWAPKVNLKKAIKLTLDYHLAHKDYRLV